MEQSGFLSQGVAAVVHWCSVCSLGQNQVKGHSAGRGVVLTDHQFLPVEGLGHPPWSVNARRTQMSSFCVVFIEENLLLQWRVVSTTVISRCQICTNESHDMACQSVPTHKNSNTAKTKKLGIQ